MHPTVGPGLGGRGVVLVSSSRISVEVDVAEDPDGCVGEWFSFRASNLPVGETLDVRVRVTAGFHAWASWDGDEWLPVPNTQCVVHLARTLHANSAQPTHTLHPQPKLTCYCTRASTNFMMMINRIVP
jgi:hypothetical protein